MTIKRQYKIKEWSRFSWDIQEALVKKFQVILTDYKEPMTKRQIALTLGKAIYSQLSKKNLNASIELIRKGTSMLSEFGKAFDNPKKGHSRKSSFNQNAFWGNESKESKRDTRKETMSFYGKKMDFW